MIKLALVLTLASLVSAQPGSPLYDYVHLDDGFFEYEEITSYVQDGFTSYVYNMTSQKWFDESWTNKPIWYHYVIVHIPDVISYTENAFLYIGSGSWDDNVPQPTDEQFMDTGVYCNRTGMVTGVIRQIPFQPTLFTTDPDQEEKVEDELIAFTWINFLEGNTNDPNTLLRFPMCKAVSKAMTLMTEVASAKTSGAVSLSKFMNSGASKRGWTTWLMPAADERVVAIAPIVLSCLNMNVNMQHYWQSMNNWTFMFFDYWEKDIPSYLNDPAIIPMLDYIDPYQYRDVLTMPKLMISGAEDEFFMPDDYDYFYDDLLGEKYIWLLENTGHSVGGGPLKEEVWSMLESWYIAIIKDRPRPEFSWARFTEQTTGDGYMIVTLDQPAVNVSAWMATTTDRVEPRRDFRQVMMAPDGGGMNTGIRWFEFSATETSPNVWRVDFEKPETGYRCFFMKMTFDYPEENRSFTFTSQAHILSNDVNRELPFDECSQTECQGYLV